MANQRNVLFILHPHDTNQDIVIKSTPEYYAILKFLTKLRTRHVGLMPSVIRYYPFIRLRSIVDDLPDTIDVRFTALPYDKIVFVERSP